jgi:hypothetical protein
MKADKNYNPHVNADGYLALELMSVAECMYTYCITPEEFIREVHQKTMPVILYKDSLFVARHDIERWVLGLGF